MATACSVKGNFVFAKRFVSVRGFFGVLKTESSCLKREDFCEFWIRKLLLAAVFSLPANKSDPSRAAALQ
jgi:hypothetical protein